METKVLGIKKKPRVVLAGNFAPELIEQYMNNFPTVLHVKDFDSLSNEIHPKEIDLLIIAEPFPVNMYALQKYVDATNVICFSKDPELRLPGPIKNTQVRIYNKIRSEEYTLSPLSLQLNRVRESQLERTPTIKNWFALVGETTLPAVKNDPNERKERTEKSKLANETLVDSAIILERHERNPLAVIYLKEDNNKRYAWLPNSQPQQIDWVIVTCSGKCDQVK